MQQSSNGNSSLVFSQQDGIHPQLEELVIKNANSNFYRPISKHMQQLFADLEKRVAIDGRKIILDSGCGVGESSVKLAAKYRQHLVIGFDKSEHRLHKNPHFSGLIEVGGKYNNLLLLRAECVDFWRMAKRANWQLEHHYILYPNPWPKKQHLKRRWHGHPVFAQMLALCPKITLRSNWLIYLQEFAHALWLLEIDSKIELLEHDGDFISPFERKYAASAHNLYQLTTIYGAN